MVTRDPLVDHQLEQRPYCPKCDRVLDGAAGGEKIPVEGDFGMCAYCIVPLRYGPGLALRLLTPEDEAEMRGQPGLEQGIRKVMEYARRALRNRRSPLPPRRRK